MLPINPEASLKALSHVGALADGLLSFASASLQANLWYEHLSLGRAWFLMVPTGIGTGVAIIGLGVAKLYVDQMPEDVLVKVVRQALFLESEEGKEGALERIASGLADAVEGYEVR